MIDLGETQVFEGEMPHAFDGGVDVHGSGADLFEQAAQMILIHTSPSVARVCNMMARNSMPKKKVDFDTVRKIASELPDVEGASAYGSPAIKVRGKMLTCMAINKSAEPGSLVVRVDFEQRAELLSGAPDVYYVTDHYVNYPAVLVRLSRIQEDALRDLLGAAWRFVTKKSPGAKRAVRGRRHPDK